MEAETMFEIIPFDYHTSRSSYDPFRHFEEMERQMFSNPVSNFRADVLTKGDSFVIEAELPGFKKEDINLDIPKRTANGNSSAANASTDPTPAASTCPTSTHPPSPQNTTTGS